MTRVNIVFDDLFEDADILCVPDEIAAHIESLGQEFLQWVPSATDSDHWVMEDGRRVLVTETDGFLKWLNAKYCRNSEKAYVLARNTQYCKDCKTIEF